MCRMASPYSENFFADDSLHRLQRGPLNLVQRRRDHSLHLRLENDGPRVEQHLVPVRGEGDGVDQGNFKR